MPARCHDTSHVPGVSNKSRENGTGCTAYHCLLQITVVMYFTVEY